MPLLDEVTAEYYRLFPSRDSRPVPFTDTEIALIKTLDRLLAPPRSKDYIETRRDG